MTTAPQDEFLERPVTPPTPGRHGGGVRRVGVEIEFTGLGADEVAGLAERVYGGKCERIDRQALLLRGSSVEEVEIALDLQLADRSLKVRTPLRSGGSASKIIDNPGTPVAPLAIIARPIPWTQLHRLDALAGELAEASMKAAAHTPVEAFGLYLNPEIQADDATAIAAVMKAFALLAPLFDAERGTGGTSRPSGYVGPWPEIYLAKLLSPDYWPDRAILANDHVEAVGDRLCGLDLLPLWAELEPGASKGSRVGDPVKGRRAYRIRLPDHGSSSGGLVSSLGNDWLRIEELAADDALLEKMCIERGRTAAADWPGVAARLIETARLPQ